MTAIAIIPRPDSILIAADSLLQKMANGDYEKAQIIGNTSVQKLFCIPTAMTVVAAYGQSTLKGRSIRQILMEVTERNNGASHCKFIRQFSECLSALGTTGTNFYASGFEDEKPYVHQIELIAASPARVRVTRRYKGNGSRVLGWCDRATNEWCDGLGLDFCNCGESEILSFIDEFFRREIDLAKRKPFPDVGEPIDVVLVTSTGISPKRLRDRQSAFLSS